MIPGNLISYLLSLDDIERMNVKFKWASSHDDQADAFAGAYATATIEDPMDLGNAEYEIIPTVIEDEGRLLK